MSSPWGRRLFAQRRQDDIGYKQQEKEAVGDGGNQVERFEQALFAFRGEIANQFLVVEPEHVVNHIPALTLSEIVDFDFHDGDVKEEQREEGKQQRYRLAIQYPKALFQYLYRPIHAGNTKTAPD